MRDKIYALLVEKCEGIECDCDVDMSCEECKGPIADAILALEVDGKTKCSLAPCCPDGRQPDPDKCRECKLNKPVTIAGLIEVK